MRSERWLAAVVVVALAACGSSGGAPDGGVGGADAPRADAATGPHPFGTHGGYVTDGVIAPSQPLADLDAATVAFYTAWKDRYVVAGCAADQRRIKTAPATSEYTVSEGHGYGMLIAAIMDGADPDAHALFDDLYRYYDAHRSVNDPGLMAWAQNASCADVEGADSATDGDLDIAYALLLADRQWGSAGAIDYRAAADQVIASIEASELHPAGSILVGDWVDPTDSHYTGTRLSDFALGHFRRFAGRGADVVERGYAIVAYLQASAAPTTGLVPDFAIDATGDAPRPAPGNWLETPDDGAYSYNACRVPWRLATDYLMNGEPRARDAVRAIEAWVRTAAGDDPQTVVDGYRLDGTPIGTSPELAFLAPLAVGAMIEPATGTNQAWLDALWDEIAARAVGEYYGDSLKLIAMIVVSGNWWVP